MTAKSLLIIIVIIFFISCDKNNDPIFRVSGTYTTDLNENIDPVILLTDHKEITDTAIILDFLRRRNLENDFIFNKASVQILPNLLTVTFNDSSINYIVSDTLSKAARMVSMSQSLIIISDIDSIKVYVPVDDNRCQFLGDSVKEINAAKVFYSVPISSGFLGYNKFTPTFALTLNNQQLFLPLINYATSFSSSTQYCYSFYKDLWNTFNSNLSNQLKEGDTIVYQTKQVPLRKQ
ncbi:MAG TPA: hypothetical protein VHB70_17220 [Parafilimonas sp.]|nr:hypothetical protein [Parafilimonas sp.]